jgi:hypothetical protein
MLLWKFKESQLTAVFPNLFPRGNFEIHAAYAAGWDVVDRLVGDRVG